MRIPANSVSEYISKVPEDRRESFEKILEILRNNLPEGFQECLGYGMPAFAVPHSLYPDGYHCKPEEPLPFISVGNQKNFIGFYHMGVYAMPEIYEWFVNEYPKHSKFKLDMGKSCLRLKRMNDIPYDLIAELAQKITPEQWIEVYEFNIKK